MHLRIEVYGKGKTYSFKKKNRVTLGRSSECDIQIIAEGVSRKHVDIFEKNGEFYAIDHNSTNGSFIDENQLKPGKAQIFNTFFPLRLGFHVNVYLLDEA